MHFQMLLLDGYVCYLLCLGSWTLSEPGLSLSFLVLLRCSVSGVLTVVPAHLGSNYLLERSEIYQPSGTSLPTLSCPPLPSKFLPSSASVWPHRWCNPYANRSLRVFSVSQFQWKSSLRFVFNFSFFRHKVSIRKEIFQNELLGYETLGSKVWFPNFCTQL